MIEAFLMSTGIVALAEMGDKTQLLALVLAARFRKPIPIILGILVATLLNHGVAGALGSWLMHWVGPQVMRWILGVSFLAMAGWILIPDKLDDTQAVQKGGVFLTTVIAFFLAEMGDKTQLATIALAAHYTTPFIVVVGTTLGMLIADIPAVFVGNQFSKKISMKLVHSIAAGIFAVMGVLTLFGIDKLL